VIVNSNPALTTKSLFDLSAICQLGNVNFAKKALFERCWTVLNYCLLDDPRLLDTPKDDVDTRVATSTCTLNTDTINQQSERYLSTLDKLLDDRLKSDGRKRKYEEVRALTTSKAEKILHLSKMLNVSSGKLACNNIFCLDETVRDKMVVDEETKQQKHREVQQRKQQQQMKHQQTFRNAATKYFDKQTLVSNEIRSLLKQVQQKGDSPLSTRITNLRQQLHRRSARLEIYNFATRIDVIDNIENIHFPKNNENGTLVQNLFLDNFPLGEYPQIEDTRTETTLLVPRSASYDNLPEFGSIGTAHS
jgi:hypothetical protein